MEQKMELNLKHEFDTLFKTEHEYDYGNGTENETKLLEKIDELET